MVHIPPDQKRFPLKHIADRAGVHGQDVALVSSQLENSGGQLVYRAGVSFSPVSDPGKKKILVRPICPEEGENCNIIEVPVGRLLFQPVTCRQSVSVDLPEGCIHFRSELLPAIQCICDLRLQIEQEVGLELARNVIVSPINIAHVSGPGQVFVQIPSHPG